MTTLLHPQHHRLDRPARADAPLKALSIRQPWAWLILHGKDIENREWATRFRGVFLIHAAGQMTRQEYEDARLFLHFAGIRGIELPPPHQLERGGIVGRARLVDCVTASDSPWFCGTVGHVLADVRPLPFHPLKGKLGYFDVTDRRYEHV